jgi:hypothetical protein
LRNVHAVAARSGPRVPPGTMPHMAVTLIGLDLVSMVEFGLHRLLDGYQVVVARFTA